MSRPDDPIRAANAAAYEEKIANGNRIFEPGSAVEALPHKREYRALKLSEARALTPAPTGIGAWAEKLRQAAFDAVKESDMTELMAGLLAKAKAGDLAAAKLVLGYLTGGGAPKVQQVLVVQQAAEQE
jgi:hypothetical protein